MEEKQDFWSKLDKVLESFFSGESGGEDFSEHGGDVNRGVE